VLLAATVAVSGLAVANLSYRLAGYTFPLDSSDAWYTLAGAVLYAALFGALGAATGSLVRNQVAAIVGWLAWLFVVEHIAEDHLGALATKELRFCGPLAPGTATDQGHFPSQPAHDSLLLARACAHTLLSACDGPIVARGETLSTLSWQQQDYSSLCRDSRIGNSVRPGNAGRRGVKMR